MGRMVRSSLRRFAANLGVSAASLVIFALLAELLLQLVVPLFRPRFTRIDPVVGWYHNSSVTNLEEFEGHRYRLSYNAHGYRPPDHTYEKPDGVLRVVVLGDSYTDGSEVGDQETFTWHLQQRLAGVEVINLGVYGYSTTQELITLDHVGFKYAPDLVLLVTTTNDYRDNHINISSFGPRPRFMVDGDSAWLEGTDQSSAREIYRATNLPVHGMTFLHRHSNLYYFLNHYIYHRLIARKITALREAQWRSRDPEERLDAYRRLVVRMKQRSSRFGADFSVVFAYQKREVQTRDDSAYRMNREVARALAAEGIAATDLYEELRQAEFGRDGSLYYGEDIHWNAAGHKVVADLLEPRIEQWKQSRLNRARVN